MPRLIFVRHTTTCNDLVALDATRRKLLFVAARTVDVVFSWDEGLGSDGGFAHTATEALLMPLATFVLHLFSSCSENFTAAIAPGRKGRIVAIGTIDLLVLGAKGLVHQRHSAFVAQEASFVPMLLFV